MTRIWTIGHSTHPLEEFTAIIKSAGIQRIADVRSVPRSRHVPQFNKDSLAATLPADGIDYLHLAELGGWRKASKESVNTGWRNEGFRGYADYMQSDEFRQAAAELLELAEQMPTAVMCSEAVPFRCHRSLIADYLTARGVEVVHVYPDGETKPHQMTAFALVVEGEITYPAQ